MKRITDRSVDRREETEDTDRDSDDTLNQIRDAEKEAQKYKEMADRAEEVAKMKKRSLKSKQRRLRRTSQPGRSLSLGVDSYTLPGPPLGLGSSQIFTTNEIEMQLKQLEKMTKEVMGPKNTHKTKLRRVKKSINKENKIAEKDWEHLVEFIEKYN